MRPPADVRSVPRALALVALTAPLLGAKPSGAPAVQRVPSVEEVVEKEGFTPTLSQSEIYRPGAVLVPNAKGGHDVIVKDCLGVQAEVSVMSQSSIATSLASGVSARVGMAKGAVSAGIEKRLSFVDPEQRTIPLAQVAATEACQKGVKNAGRLVDLSQAVVIYDVLVAQIKNSVCTKADASGGVVTLGAVEAAAFSECVQESDAQVPLGYKAVPLGQLMSVGPAAAGAPPAAQAPAAAAPGSRGASATQGAWAGGGAVVAPGDLAKQLAAAEKQKAELEARLAACLKAEADKVRAQAKADWGELAPLAAKTDATTKALAKGYMEKFVAVYGSAKVSCSNDLGERSELVPVAELAQARAWLERPPGEPASAAPSADPGRVVGSSGYALRLVPAGKATMGCTAGQDGKCQPDEWPAREVTLSRSVLVGETEVTQGLYQRLMGSNPSHFAACGADCPVEQLSWFDAVRLANKLSAAEGLEACYVVKGESVSWPKGTACKGYRLPTEAEWEAAARAGGDTRYAGGDKLSAVAWHAGNSGKSTHPVGQKDANALGLHDMSGNVWEWVWDGYLSEVYTEGAAVDPKGPASGVQRVQRGGGYLSDAQDLRVTRRSSDLPANAVYFSGVRLVRTAP